MVPSRRRRSLWWQAERDFQAMNMELALAGMPKEEIDRAILAVRNENQDLYNRLDEMEGDPVVHQRLVKVRGASSRWSRARGADKSVVYRVWTLSWVARTAPRHERYRPPARAALQMRVVEVRSLSSATLALSTP
jgi:hypothetical protein